MRAREEYDDGGEGDMLMGPPPKRVKISATSEASKADREGELGNLGVNLSTAAAAVSVAPIALEGSSKEQPQPIQHQQTYQSEPHTQDQNQHQDKEQGQSRDLDLNLNRDKAQSQSESEYQRLQPHQRHELGSEIHSNLSSTSNSNPAQSVSLEGGVGKGSNEEKESTEVKKEIKMEPGDEERDTRKEQAVGIVCFVNKGNPGWEGVLKQRYTDFLVNEIMPDGTVCYLTDDKAPKRGMKNKPDASTSTFAPSSAEKQDTVNEGELEAAKAAKAAKAETTDAATNTLAAAIDVALGIKKSSDTIDGVPEVKIGDDESTTGQSTATNFTIKDADATQLAGYVGNEFKDEVVSFHQKVISMPDGSVLEPIMSKAVNEPGTRGKIHALIGRMFESRIKTKSDENCCMIFFAAERKSYSDADATKLADLVGNEFKDKVIALHQKILSKPDAKAGEFDSLLSKAVNDKATRTEIHKLVRVMFKSQIVTVMADNNCIGFYAAGKQSNSGGNNNRSDRFQPRQGQLNGKLGWDELGGQHLHFSLYKENKDTMEVVSFLAKLLHVKPSEFAFAGTKDRRAATVQRVSVCKQHADKLATCNRQLRNARVGNFSYEKQRLELGELAGNLFTITLRDCHFAGEESCDEEGKVKLATEVVSQAVTNLRKNGFINYFGLQRFGTFEIGTDEIGKLILQGKFKEATEAILTYSEETLAKAKKSLPTDKIGKDDLDRARALDLFKRTKNTQEATYMLPRRFAAETAIIRHLGSRGKSQDYLGALSVISRNLKTMYVHAYQSYVWNMVASERWARYGAQVVEGDLILIDRAAEKSSALDEFDENGEIVINPAGDEVAVSHDDIYERARPLSAEEASSGSFAIFDIVLPTPGFDMEYPRNESGEYYKVFMKSDLGGGLDPYNMRRPQKDFSLSGAYRKFMGTIGEDFGYDVRMYKEELEQLVETDWEKLQKGRSPNENRSGNDNLRNDFKDNSPAQAASPNAAPPNSAQTQAAPTQAPRYTSPNNGSGNGQSPTTGRDGQRSRGSPGARGTRGARGRGRTHNFNEEAARNREQYRDSPQLNAWMALPGKLASDEKALAEAADAADKTRERTTIAPVIHETWIQRSANNFSVLTGKAERTVINEGRGSNAGKSEAASEPNAAADPMDIDTEVVKRAVTSLDKSDNTSISSEDVSHGGAALTPLYSNTPEKPARSPLATSTLETEARDTTIDVDQELEEKRTRIAVILKFSLKTSQYATVALRELMQGVRNFKPDYNSGR